MATAEFSKFADIILSVHFHINFSLDIKLFLSVVLIMFNVINVIRLRQELYTIMQLSS